MENLLKSVAIGWNPIGEVRRRMDAGTLSVGSVLIPFIGVVIACNLFSMGAQNFFFETILYRVGGQMPNHPLLTNDFAKRLMSAIGILIPVAAVAMLPARIFDPPGRSATISSMLAVAAAWAFYGACLGVLVYFVSGTLATIDLQAGLNAYLLLSIPMMLIIIGLTLFFWFRITLSVLGLSGGQVAGISIIALIAGGIMIWIVVMVGMAIF